MRVLYISTWGAECGISTYTEELVEGSRGLWDSLVSGPFEAGSGVRPTPPVPFKQHWQRTSPGLDQLLLLAVEEFGPDIVHVQHEFGLFQQPLVFLRAMRALKRKVPVVVTLHTVNWSGSWEHSIYYRDLGQCVDLIVTHLPEAMASIGLYAPNVTCIPHGTGAFVEGDRERGIELLRLAPNLANALRHDPPCVCLLNGFIGAGKNLSGTLRALAMAEARNLCPPVIVLLVGRVFDAGLLAHLQWLLSHTGLELRSAVCPDFVPAADLRHVFALADFGVLNTSSWTLSASGAAHVYARYGVPLAVANRPIYQEAVRGGALAFDLRSDVEDPADSAVSCLAALVGNRGLRQHVASEMRQWAEATAWPVVAQRHLEVYEQVLARRAEVVSAAS